MGHRSMVLIHAALADANGATGKKNGSTAAWSFGKPETLTLFNEESGHLVAATEDNQP